MGGAPIPLPPATAVQFWHHRLPFSSSNQKGLDNDQPSSLRDVSKGGRTLSSLLSCQSQARLEITEIETGSKKPLSISNAQVKPRYQIRSLFIIWKQSQTLKDLDCPQFELHLAHLREPSPRFSSIQSTSSRPCNIYTQSILRFVPDLQLPLNLENQSWMPPSTWISS